MVACWKNQLDEDLGHQPTSCEQVLPRNPVCCGLQARVTAALDVGVDAEHVRLSYREARSP